MHGFGDRMRVRERARDIAPRGEGPDLDCPFFVLLALLRESGRVDLAGGGEGDAHHLGHALPPHQLVAARRYR